MCSLRSYHAFPKDGRVIVFGDGRDIFGDGVINFFGCGLVGEVAVSEKKSIFSNQSGMGGLLAASSA